MSNNEIQGKNWYREVKSPKDSVDYDKRMEFYVKRAEVKAGLKYLAKDFEVTVNSQIERGLFKSLDDLKRVERKEYKIRKGDTLFKVVEGYFKDIVDSSQAEKETYLTLAFLMKTNSASNVDKFYAGGSVVIENGRITVADSNGNTSYNNALMRPELGEAESETELPELVSESDGHAEDTQPISDKSESQFDVDEDESELKESVIESETEAPQTVPVSEIEAEVEKKDEEYKEEVKGTSEEKEFEEIKSKIDESKKELDVLVEKNLNDPAIKQEAQKALEDVLTLIEKASELPDESYPVERVEAFKEEIKQAVEKIEEQSSDVEVQNAARAILDMEPVPEIVEALPLSKEGFKYGGSDLEFTYFNKLEKNVTLDPEKGEKYFYHWIVNHVDEQGLFRGNELLNTAPLDKELYGLLIDKIIGICRELNSGINLDKPESFNGKNLVLPQGFDLKIIREAEVQELPDENLKGQFEKGSVSKLLKLGKKDPYYVLNLPKGADVKNAFEWSKVEEFNKASGIVLKEGEPFRIPASQLSKLLYQGEVRFIELSLKDVSKKDTVVSAITKNEFKSKELINLFTESFYYKKPKAANRIVVPMAILKGDWEEFLLDEYKVKPAQFRENSVYQTGEYDLFLKHATGVESLKYEDRDQMIKDKKVEKVSTEGRKFRFKGEFSSEKEKYLRPYANKALDEIVNRFYQETGYMLMLTSIFRTPSEQKNLAEGNSAATKGVSTHNFANSFDIANGRFLNPAGKEVTWSGVTGAEREKLTSFRPVIEKILTEMQKEGKLMALRELYAWHVMIANPDIGDGTELIARDRQIDPERETPTLDLESLKEINIDFSKISEFNLFSSRLIETIRDRKESGRKMKISEVQEMIKSDLLKKLRDSGQKEAADILVGRTFEMAHVINILASTQKSNVLKESYCVYDERPDVACEIVSFKDFAEKYALFKEARTSKTSKLKLVDENGDQAGDYNMYKFLTQSNVKEFIDPNLLMAKIAQETNFTFVKNLGGEKSDYTNQTVFGYFQITGKQDAKTEKRAKEVFNQLTGIPGTRFDFKEFKVPYGKGKYFVNPRAEIALAIAIYEKNAEKIRDANGGLEHIDEELLTILSYNHGTLYIEDILEHGVAVSEYGVLGGYKLSYVDSNGTVHIKTVDKDQKKKIRSLINKSKIEDLKKYLKKEFNISFIPGRTIGVRVSEVEKIASIGRYGKGQLYISQILAKSIMFKYIDMNNFEDMDSNALADSMIALSSQKPVSQSNIGNIRPRDLR